MFLKTALLPRRRLLTGIALALATLGIGVPPAARALESGEVPFVVTPDNVTLEMLRLAHVGARDYVLDLGSGDGRIVIQAARRYGARGLGVEIVPELVQRSRVNAQAAGVADRVEFREQDLFKTDLSAATVVTMYLMPEVNLQLRPALLALKPGTRVVSHDWDMGDWKPDRSVSVAAPDKPVGVDKTSRLHLWVVPAKVGGLWCGKGLLQSYRLELQQQYQHVRGTLHRRERARAFEGQVDGTMVRSTVGAPGQLTLELQGEDLRISAAEGSLGLLTGLGFRRAAADRC